MGRCPKLHTLLLPAFLAGLVGIPVALADSDYLSEAIKEYNAGHFDKAVGLLGAAAPTDFDNPVLHYYLGGALVKINHNDDAIKQYKIALALDPPDQMAAYCRQALRRLGALPPEARIPKGATKPGTEKAPQEQTPQIISFMCGCPLCIRLEDLLTSVERKYGQRIQCQRNLKGSWSADATTIATHYQVTQCPTVLFFDAKGNCIGQQSGLIPERDMTRLAQALSDSAIALRPVPPPDKNSSLRDSIMQEAQMRINDAQRLLDEEIRRVQARTDEDINNLPRRTANWYSGEIRQEGQKRIQQLQNDFDRRKQDIMSTAESRLQSLGPSSSSSAGTYGAHRDGR